MAGFVHGDATGMADAANQLQPAVPGAGRQAADAIAAVSGACGKPIPGCKEFFAAQAATAREFSGFFARAQQTVTGLQGAATGSANDYTRADTAGQGGFQHNAPVTR